MADETATVTGAGEQTPPAGTAASTADAEKTFTQAEVDALVEARLTKATKGMPDKAELAAFRSWKQSQQTEADKLSAAERERDEAKDEAEQYRRQLYLLAAGVPADDLDYYAFKIGKLVTADKDFETAAEEFLRGRPVKAAAQQSAAAAPEGAEKQQPEGGVRFTAPLGAGESPKTKDEIMAIKDRKARRAAILEHKDIFEH